MVSRRTLADARAVFYAIATPQMVAHAAVISSRAGEVAACLGLDDDHQDLCAAVGLVHDIGKAAQVRKTGFHQLDGALYVEPTLGPRVAGLVAHHSGASTEAKMRGIELPYPREESDVAVVLDYCDLTTLPSGRPISPEERRADIDVRHGADSPGPRALSSIWADVLALDERLRGLVQQRPSGLAPGIEVAEPVGAASS
jgi:hypothetical protein